MSSTRKWFIPETNWKWGNKDADTDADEGDDEDRDAGVGYGQRGTSIGAYNLVLVRAHVGGKHLVGAWQPWT